MSGALDVNGVAKAYRQYKGEIQRVASWFVPNVYPAKETWVLEDISFSLSPGEAVGIIGQNGAGKSTLLKIITGTTKPTNGSVQVKGKIAAILELGMGFNPDLTGRQNVYHSAGLMGYTSEQIDTVINNIEEFAEIGKYFEDPVRTFSSGMQMRVAFAVATAFRPDILIIDEALSVGDSYFQHKSFDRIREFREQGTSLLFVSHDKGAILALCDRAILLDKGHLLRDGDPEEITDYYNALIAEKANSTIEQVVMGNGGIQTRSGTAEAKVIEVALYNAKGQVAEYVGVGERVELRIKVKVYQSIETLVLGYGIKDRLGQVMHGTNTWHTKQVINKPNVGSEYEFVIAFQANLGVGSYSIQTALVDRDTHLTANYEWLDLALVFNVINIDKVHFAGCMWIESRITIEEYGK
ncbi:MULTISPECIES: ABC transporter ATP-binding protein [Desulfosporosinus]|uniref:Lipopolysaccharide transport system ATP-binding protein n=1 Tax=Desulfosporosinus lacus DSM 15449 TaxID=1121420 RepID=A0A1M5RXN9_9FIRM|nr:MULTISPECIES: ABC transporter ATP-binding protein [Desulfosporosinus]MDA8221049.1 ABC transporter ATP-binding protein [Desulfitobacterium hafniense]SHH31005.1 lipopolysaccharide transport system ATP-binding protein [Desulfosporosinus lacus DSM 15449]